MLRLSSRLWHSLRHWTADSRKNINIIIGCTSFSLLLISCTKKIPPGFVGLIEDWNGNLKPYVFDDGMVCLFLPIYQRTISFRIMPVKKKFINEYITKDGKKIEIVLQMRLQPQIPYVVGIYSRFGKDYAKAFVEQEAGIDLKHVVQESLYESLIANDENTDKIVNELSERFQDACAFHRLILSEFSINFRSPIVT